MHFWGFESRVASWHSARVSKIVGIDLGTTNSLVAIVDSGIPYVIADAAGRRLTPSVVYIPPAGAAPIVGQTAIHMRAAHPAETVFSVKRFIGRRATDISLDKKLVPYPIEGNDNPYIEINGRKFSPEEISCEILKKLKSDAEAALGEPVTRAVITVPAYFNDAQRSATKLAGELAGFTVERIINEPTAAALAYGLDKSKDCAKVAVYDLGGGTFDLSILELNSGVFQVLATNGNTRLGGDDIDRLVNDWLASQIITQGGPAELDLTMTARVSLAAEAAKVALSIVTETEITLPFLSPTFSFQQRLTRAELERIAGPIIEQTRTHCLRALADAKIEPTALDQVILVGGQTRMPLVRRCVSEWFGCSEFEEGRGGVRIGTEHHLAKGPALNTSQNPDEAVALGAAILGAILSGEFKNLLLLDVTPLSLGIETFGGLMNVIIPRNSTIPTKAGEVFTTAVDNQKDVLIHVLQGERDRAKDNWSLGRFTLGFERAPRGVPRVGVQFEIDADGILNVLARDIKTGKQTVVPMNSAVDVDDAKVQQMVEESVEHAFEDLATRRWIEASLGAREAVTASRKALIEFETELGAESLREIVAAVSEVEAALATEGASQSGDVTRLKNAAAILDRCTGPLADLMIAKAAEERLIRQGLLSR